MPSLKRYILVILVRVAVYENPKLQERHQNNTQSPARNTHVFNICFRRSVLESRNPEPFFHLEGARGRGDQLGAPGRLHARGIRRCCAAPGRGPLAFPPREPGTLRLYQFGTTCAMWRRGLRKTVFIVESACLVVLWRRTAPTCPFLWPARVFFMYLRMG